jgi:hypothetical protein
MVGVKKVKSGYVVDRDPAPESDSDLALRCAALTSAFAAARAEIDRLQAKREEAANESHRWRNEAERLRYQYRLLQDARSDVVRKYYRLEIDYREDEKDHAAQVESVNEALRQKTEEADNLRASTAVLFRERDDARRMVCDEWHDPAAGALHHGWVGLYSGTPATEEINREWGCEKLNGPCVYSRTRRRCHDSLCGDWCEHFEPEEDAS